MTFENLIINVEYIEWNKQAQGIYLEGYAYIKNINIDTNEKSKKSFYITNGDKKFFIAVNNTLRTDITEKYGNSLYNYDYAGFSGNIDLGFIDNMGPLSEGKWEIGLHVNSDGQELQSKINYSGLGIKVEPKKIVNKNKKVINYIYLDIIDNDVILRSESHESKSAVYNHIRNKYLYKPIKKLKKKMEKPINNLKTKTVDTRHKIAAPFVKRLYSLFSLFPIKENRITFLTDSRGGLYGNFRMVYEEIERRGGYEFKSVLKPPYNMKKTLIEKISIVYYMATSKCVFLDDYYPFIYNIKPREGVQLVQLWHAPGAFKTFGYSRVGKLGWTKNPRAKNHRAYTHAIVSSKNIKKHYAEAYGISEDKVIATGVPRTDVFFDENYKRNKIEELYNKYPILKGKKVIMFAPTFRGKGRGGYYDFKYFHLDKIMEKFKDEYVLIMKLHPFISNAPTLSDRYKDFAIDLSHENEINDLLFLSDILITDYSSVCFEYALLNRPMVFFAYDLEEYIYQRDFYYPYESFVPGPIARTTEDIIDIIENKKFELEKLDKFRNKFFDHFDGKSTQRVVDMLLNNK